MLVFLTHFLSFCSCATLFWNRPHFGLVKLYNITVEQCKLVKLSVIREILTYWLLLKTFIVTSSRFF